MTLVKDNSVQAINTALLSVKRDISVLTATKNPSSGSTDETTAGLEPGKTYDINISGNAATATRATSATNATTADKATNANHATTAENATTAETATTANKVANALTVNGKTYDGSSAVDAGVQTVANGGTGVTTANAAADLFIGSLPASDGVPVDTDFFISQEVNGGPFVPAYYRRPISKLWEYIKGKISSILGLTKDNYGGKANTAGTADKTVNDIAIDIPFVNESGQYVIPLGNILPPGSGEVESPYNWDITGFFSIIRPSGHAGSHIQFEAGHGYSHGFTTYAYLDEKSFTDAGNMHMSIKAFQYNGKWWLGLWINTQWQGYFSKMTITYSRGLPATPTCILYNSESNGVANKEIYDSIQDIPSWWWRRRTIHNPITFTQNITAPNITSLEQRIAALESRI